MAARKLTRQAPIGLNQITTDHLDLDPGPQAPSHILHPQIVNGDIMAQRRTSVSFAGIQTKIPRNYLETVVTEPPQRVAAAPAGAGAGEAAAEAAAALHRPQRMRAVPRVVRRVEPRTRSRKGRLRGGVEQAPPSRALW